MSRAAGCSGTDTSATACSSASAAEPSEVTVSPRSRASRATSRSASSRSSAARRCARSSCLARWVTSRSASWAAVPADSACTSVIDRAPVISATSGSKAAPPWMMWREASTPASSMRRKI